MSVTRLIQASGRFLEEAHRLAPSVESDNATSDYYRLIRAGVNCLLTALDKHASALDPVLEAQLCYKVSQVLFKETSSLELASEYCQRGIQLCARSEPLYGLGVKLKLLNFQIQYQSDANSSRKSVLTYLNTWIKETPPSSVELRAFLGLVKYRYFGITFSDEQCRAILRDLVSTLESRITPESFSLYQVVCFYEIHRLLFSRRPIQEVKTAFNNLVYQRQSHSDLTESQPIQFKAMILLVDLFVSLQEDDTGECKRKIGVIGAFIKRCKKDDTQWGPSTRFEMVIGSLIPLEIGWLSFTEFSAVAYFFCGASYLAKSWDGKGRAQKLFSHCHKLLETEDVNEWNTSAGDVEGKRLRTGYAALLLDAYSRLAELAGGQLEESCPALSKFVSDYDNSQFSSQELVAYHQLVPMMFYMWAVAHQKAGRLDLAKYYYLKLMRLYSPDRNELSTEEFFTDPVMTSVLQSALGLEGSMLHAKGVESQLYCLSCVNVLALTLHDLDSSSGSLTDLSEFLKLKELIETQLRPLQSSQDSVMLATLTCVRLAADPAKLEEAEIPALWQDGEWLDGLCQVAPLLASTIFYIKGKAYKNDITKPELDNLNSRIQLYTKAYKQAIKLGESKNMMGYLASSEIHAIMYSYRNYFGQSQVDAVRANMEKTQID